MLNLFNQSKSGQSLAPKKYMLNGYHIQELKLISEGGYGYIWKAKDIYSKQKFAIKKMNCQVQLLQINISKLIKKGQEKLEMAKMEQKILSQINSNHVIKYYGGEIQQNQDGSYTAIFILELCTGGSLFDLIVKNEHNKLSEQQIVNILTQIAIGINDIHSLRPKISHRDIKIENILLEQNVCKICDFGSSSSQILDFNIYQCYSKIDQNNFPLYEEQYEKSTTLMYRPPEMCDLYKKYKVNQKVDIWMLGCVAYALCFYRHPFVDCSKMAIAEASYDFPENSQYSEKIIDLIRIMLTPNPKYRPNIQQVLQILIDYEKIVKINQNEISQKIKVEQAKRKAQLKKLGKNIKHFDGNIPLDELEKLQKMIQKEQQNDKFQNASSYQQQKLIQQEVLKQKRAEQFSRKKNQHKNFDQKFQKQYESDNATPNIFQQIQSQQDLESDFKNFGEFNYTHQHSLTQQQEKKQKSHFQHQNILQNQCFSQNQKAQNQDWNSFGQKQINENQAEYCNDFNQQFNKVTFSNQNHSQQKLQMNQNNLDLL